MVELKVEPDKLPKEEDLRSRYFLQHVRDRGERPGYPARRTGDPSTSPISQTEMNLGIVDDRGGDAGSRMEARKASGRGGECRAGFRRTSALSAVTRLGTSDRRATPADRHQAVAHPAGVPVAAGVAPAVESSTASFASSGRPMMGGNRPGYHRQPGRPALIPEEMGSRSCTMSRERRPQPTSTIRTPAPPAVRPPAFPDREDAADDRPAAAPSAILFPAGSAGDEAPSPTARASSAARRGPGHSAPRPDRGWRQAIAPRGRTRPGAGCVVYDPPDPHDCVGVLTEVDPLRSRRAGIG